MRYANEAARMPGKLTGQGRRRLGFLKIIVFAAAIVILTGAPSRAAVTRPVITGTVADTATMTLIIEGINLPNGTVYMGQVGGGVEKLEILSFSTTSIEAQLLTSEPGTYILALVLDKARILTGSVTVGAPVPQSLQGPQGPSGPPGISGYSYKSFSNFSTIPPGSQENVLAICSGGKKIISGGWQEITASGDLVSVGSYPSSEATWNSRIRNTGVKSRSYSFYYICADVAP